MGSVILRATIGMGIALFAAVADAQNLGVTELRLEPAAPSVSGGETVRLALTIKRDPSVAPQALTFTLESSQDALTRFPTRTVEVPAGQGRTFIDMGTGATPIRTQLTVSATLKSPSGIRTTTPLELVPALIKQVTLSATSLTGTLGANLTATVELKAPAPPGGIQVYSGIKGFTPIYLKKSDRAPIVVTVPAGTRVATLLIRYDDLLEQYSSQVFNNPSFDPDFERVTRTAEQFVALDPPVANWVPIVDRSVRLTYVMNPLRITAISAQPTTLAVGSEAAGTFTLSAAPAANEHVIASVSGSAAKVVPMGASCQSTSPNNDFVLVAGATVQNFKICARPVSSPTTVNVRIYMRSGEYVLPITVRP